MAISAESVQDSEVTPEWENLAFSFMEQAVLEMVVVNRASDLACFDEAFAWGYIKDETRPDGSWASSLKVAEDARMDWSDMRHSRIIKACLPSLMIH